MGLGEVVPEEKSAPVRLRGIRISDHIPAGRGVVEYVMGIYREAMDLFIRSKAEGHPAEWDHCLITAFFRHAPVEEDPALSLERMDILLERFGKIFYDVPASDPASIKAYLINYGGASWSDLTMYYTKYSLSVLFTVIPPHVFVSALGVGLTVAFNQA